MVDDFVLLDRWAAGDDAAARTLVERHTAALYRFFRNKAGDAVDDLLQETLLACTAGRDRFRRDATFRTFLFATARNVLFAHYRKRKKLSAETAIGDSSLCDLGESPSAILARNAEQRLLLEGLRRLSFDHQIVLELVQWEQLTGPEVARVLGISEAAMRSRLHRARTELRVTLEAISDDREVLTSTLDDLDGWAHAVRRELA